MQVAYRPAVVRRLGPASLHFRSNSTAAITPKKSSYKSATWGDRPLPGRGEVARDKASNGSLGQDRPQSASLSSRLKQWSKTSENRQPPAPERTQSLNVGHAVDITKDMKAWQAAVEDLPSTRPGASKNFPSSRITPTKNFSSPRTTPVKNITSSRMRSYAGTDWIPGQEFVTEERPSKRTPNSQRPKRDRPQGDRASASDNRRVSRNAQRRDTRETFGKERSRPFTEGQRPRRRAREIEEEEESGVNAALVFNGEGGIELQPGQTEEEWLTEYLMYHPKPEAPKDPQADVDIATGAHDMFATQTPISTIALSVPAAAKVSNASPARILRRHGGDYAHFLPLKVQSTALKDLPFLSHAHLVMGKRREIQFTQKTQAIDIIKRNSQLRPQKA